MVQRGGEALFHEIKEAGVDVNVADPSGRTLLLHAVHLAATCTDKLRQRVVDSITCLLQNGADVNLAAERGQTPLSLALTLRQKDLAWLLLEHGAEATPGIQ
jgi:ankyrin repeat protein